jgi:hypothetical protein
MTVGGREVKGSLMIDILERCDWNGSDFTQSFWISCYIAFQLTEAAYAE